MASRIVLISDDTDYFDFIKEKLAFRKSDELFSFSFEKVPEKISLLEDAVLIINSESSREKTLEILKIFKNTPCIVSAYNEDLDFKTQCYKNGAFDYVTILTTDRELQARLIPALSYADLLKKNKQYRDILVNKDIISVNNEVYLDYNYIIDKELENINLFAQKAVFGAISPNEKGKFLIKQNLIETTVLNNIRKNDILINFAANKYFLLLYDTTIENAEKTMEKINSQLPQQLYAGFSSITNQKRQQLVDEVLNKLHRAINKNKNFVEEKPPVKVNIEKLENSSSAYTNFKMYKKDFEKKIEQVIAPAFYHIQQKYTNKMTNTSMQHELKDGLGVFYIKGKNSNCCFKITGSGFSKINIDMTLQKDTNTVDTKRITLEPEELESGLLEDILEQFVTEYNNYNKQ